MSLVYKLIYKLFGWKVEGRVPEELKKAVLIVMPHNTWKDFTVGLGARALLKRKIGYLGKEELFKGPLGFLFKWWGGTPVIRTGGSNIVEDYGRTIRQAENMLFAMAPEGTRKDVQKSRTGFYYMAIEGGIPIIPVAFDFKKKVVKVGKNFMPTGEFEKDMQENILPFYADVPFLKSWYNNYLEGKFE